MILGVYKKGRGFGGSKERYFCSKHTFEIFQYSNAEVIVGWTEKLHTLAGVHMKLPLPPITINKTKKNVVVNKEIDNLIKHPQDWCQLIQVKECLTMNSKEKVI